MKIGQQVRIKHNAFPESPEQRDIYARGKIGEIVEVHDFIEVALDKPMDGDTEFGIYPCLESELDEVATE